MEDIIRRRPNESEEAFVKRIVSEKLIDKTLDVDFVELAPVLFGQELSSSECRKRMYGIKRLIEVSNNELTTIESENGDYEQVKSYKETIEINKDGSFTSDKLIGIEDESQLKDEEFLLKVHKYDSKVWEIVTARNSIWNAQKRGGHIIKMYASRVTVKPRTEYRWNKEDVEKIFNGLKTDYKNKKNITPKQYEQNGKLLVVPIADFHFGLVSDKYSNGNDYNLDIAEELFFQVLDDVMETNKGRKFEKVLFVIGNDATNSDNLNSTTAKGTPQQDCAMWFTVVDRVTKLLIKGIDTLTSIAPVDVVYVPSNHDLHTMFGVTQTISAWYRNDNNVTVDVSPLPRKYYKFGKNVLAFSHDVKEKDALKIVSTEAKDMWTDSDRVIFMLAHLHQSMVYEKQGMLEILRLPTISGYSRWTNNQGYIQTERKNQAFIIDYNKGIKETQNTILDL